MTLLRGEKFVGDFEPERIAVGEVIELSSEVKSFESQDHSGRYLKRLVAVGDSADPHERAKLNAVIDLWDRFLLEHNKEYPIPSMKNGYKKNPVYDWFHDDEGLEQGTMKAWRDELVPTAKALYPMQMLDDMDRPFSEGTTVTERAKRILELTDDAVAIRARAAIMKSIAVEVAMMTSEKELKLVSLGAGAAVPAIAAVQEVERALGKKVSMDLYDISEDILDFAGESTKRAGIAEDRVTKNVGSYENFYKLEDESVDILEALGLWEYLPTSRCRELMEQAYRVVKPGGVIVISNMLKDRKQLAFNQRGVAWPGVKPRTEEELIKTAVEAGIPIEAITYTVSEDGVYGIIEVRKPV